MSQVIVVSSGVTSSGVTIFAHGSAVVLRGGSLTSSIIEGHGSATVSAGGYIIGTEFQSASHLFNSGGGIVQAGTFAAGAHVINHGQLLGGIAATTVSNGDVASGVLVSGTVGFQADMVLTDSTARDRNVVVTSYGLEFVGAGIATGTTVESGGAQVVYGGTAIDTVVEAYGRMSDFAEGSVGGVSGAIIESGGIFSGGDQQAATIAVQSGGNALLIFTPRATTAAFAAQVQSGGILVADNTSGRVAADLLGTTISAGGTLVLLGGDTETGASIAAGGTLDNDAIGVLSSGAFITGGSLGLGSNTLGAAMSETVFSGGTARLTVISSGGELKVELGGIASSTDVAASGVVVLDGGLAQNTTIQSGGEVFVLSGTDRGVTVSGGGVLQGATLGLASNVTILSGGEAVLGRMGDVTVASGGLLQQIKVASAFPFFGAVNVQSGGVAKLAHFISGLTVEAGGQLIVGSKTTVSRATIAAGATLVVVGPVGTPVNLSGTTLASGAQAFDIGRATQDGLQIDAGATLTSVTADLFGALGESGGPGLISAADVIFGGTVDGLGSATAFSGGTLTQLQVGGAAFIDTGGTAVSLTVISTSVPAYAQLDGLFVSSGGVASGTTLVAGGLAHNRGSVVGTVISAGGTLFDSGGGAGFDRNTTILSGGVASIGSASSVDAAIHAGGVQFVNRGFDIGATVGAGGLLSAGAFSEVSGTTLLSGAMLAISGADSVTNTVISAGATIDAIQFRYAAGGSASLGGNDLLTISEGGQTYTLQLAGDYTGEAFHLAKDAGNGTLITLSAASPASAGAAARGEFIAVARAEAAQAAPGIGALGGRADPVAVATETFAHLLAHRL